MRARFLLGSTGCPATRAGSAAGGLAGAAGAPGDNGAPGGGGLVLVDYVFSVVGDTDPSAIVKRLE